MSTFDILFLGYIIAAFTLFGVVLAGTTWYSRDRPGQGGR